MAFVTLVSDVFRYGCDESMRTAIRDHDYLQRFQQGPRPALDDDSALVALLGNKLADRAFRNIPWQLRRRIGEWNNGIEAQLRLLRDICKELNSRRWRRAGERSYEYNSDVRSALPASTGSWQRGKVQPNCLGVAQMMVGFARAVGAPHWLGNVIQANQDTLLQYEIQALGQVQAFLEEFADFGEYADGFKHALWNTLESAGDPKQAHHLLIVQLADDSWWAVDPYLNALYPLECGKWNVALDWVMQNPNSVVQVRPRTPVGDYITRISRHMQVLEFACSVFNGRFGDKLELPEPVLDLLSYIAAYAQTAAMPSDIEELGTQLMHLESKVNGTDHDTAALENASTIALICAIYDIEDIAALDATISKRQKEMADEFIEQLEKAMQDRDLEKQLALRLIRYILKDFLHYLEDLHHDPDTRQHDCLEIVWAPLGIGVATLNHVQGKAIPGSARQQTPSLVGRLCTILPSQWVLYDTLALALERGEPIHPDYLPGITEILERIYSTPDMMIEPLRLIDHRE